MAELQFAFPIAKHERMPDGRLMIEGIATSETPDKQNDVMDFNGSVAAFGKWRGNVREAHDPTKMVGKALDWWPVPEQKVIGVRAFVSAGAPDTQKKVLDGTLSMFSVGGSARRTAFEKVGDRQVRRVTEWDMTELSLVDSGANPDAAFALVKSDGVATEILAEDAEKGDAPGHAFRDNQYTKSGGADNITKEEAMADDELEKGGQPGHPFYGNQYTEGGGEGAGGEEGSNSKLSDTAVAHHTRSGELDREAEKTKDFKTKTALKEASNAHWEAADKTERAATMSAKANMRTGDRASSEEEHRAAAEKHYAAAEKETDEKKKAELRGHAEAHGNAAGAISHAKRPIPQPL